MNHHPSIPEEQGAPVPRQIGPALAFLFVHSELDDAGLNPSQFRVYAHLRRRSDVNGMSYPGIPSIAETCGMKEKTVREALRELQRRQMLEIRDRRGTSRVYLLTASDRWVAPSPKGGLVPTPSPKGEPVPTRSRGRSRANPSPKGRPPSQKEASDVTPPQKGYHPLPQKGDHTPPQKGETKDIQEGNPKKDIQSPNPPTPISPPSLLPQPQAVGGEDEEGEYLPQEELWQRVCRIVGRPVEIPRTAREEEALRDNDGVVSEANMQILERHAAAEYARKGNRGKRTARTLLTHLLNDVKDAWVWSRSAPAATQPAGLPAQEPARAQLPAGANPGTTGDLLAPEAIWQRVCQVLRCSQGKSPTQPEQVVLQRCSAWLGEADLQLLENDERRKQTYPRHQSESAYNFLNHAEGRVRKFKSGAASTASVGQPDPTAAPFQKQPAANTGAADELLAPEDLWLRVCQVVGRPTERSRNRKEQLALDHCIDVWESDMRCLESYAAHERGLRYRRTARTLLQCMRTELNTAQEWDRHRPAESGTSHQPAPATGHKRPTVDEVFAFISKVKWPIEVARAYIDARTRTDPPWHLPAANDHPAQLISADWHADVNLFLKDWNEVEERKRKQRDLELF